MRLRTILLLALLLILVVIFMRISPKESTAEFKPLELEVGEVFDELDYGKTMYVLNYAIGDVTGDGQSDMAIMVGNKENVEDSFSTSVDVVVYDPQKQTFQKAGLKSLEGWNSKMKLADFTADGILDILVVLANEDGTQNVRVMESKEAQLSEIFHKRDNRGIVIVGEITDGLKAHLRCGKLNQELTLDVSDMKPMWVTENKVAESGKILDLYPQVNTKGFQSVEVVMLSNQNALQTTQPMVTFSRK